MCLNQPFGRYRHGIQLVQPSREPTPASAPVLRQQYLLQSAFVRVTLSFVGFHSLLTHSATRRYVGTQLLYFRLGSSVTLINPSTLEVARLRGDAVARFGEWLRDPNAPSALGSALRARWSSRGEGHDLARSAVPGAFWRPRTLGAVGPRLSSSIVLGLRAGRSLEDWSTLEWLGEAQTVAASVACPPDSELASAFLRTRLRLRIACGPMTCLEESLAVGSHLQRTHGWCAYVVLAHESLLGLCPTPLHAWLVVNGAMMTDSVKVQTDCTAIAVCKPRFAS